MPLQVLNGPIIRAGESLSDGLDFSAGKIVRLTMPVNWASAPLTFQISTDGEGYNDLYHLQVVAGSYSGYEVTLNAVVPGIGLILPTDFGKGANFVKFRSGTRSLPIIQSADREFAVAIEVP